MSAEQATFADVDFRSDAERRAEAYRAEMADRARQTGMRRARVGDPDGYQLAVETILRVLTVRETVTADDVQEATPIRSNAIGAAFGALSRAGRLRVVGFTTARRPEAHARIQRIWGRAP